MNFPTTDSAFAYLSRDTGRFTAANVTAAAAAIGSRMVGLDCDKQFGWTVFLRGNMSAPCLTLKEVAQVVLRYHASDRKAQAVTDRFALAQSEPVLPTFGRVWQAQPCQQAQQGPSETITAAPTTTGPRTYAPGREFLSQQTNLVFMVPNVALVGADLLASVEAHKNLTVKSDLVAASGYVHSESGRPAYTEFYTELLAAKNAADPNYYVTVNDAIEEDKTYDELSLKTKELYDEIDSRFGEKWPHCEVLHFMQLLDDIGIATIDNFDAAFHTVVSDNYKWEAEFAEEYVCEAEHGLSDSIAFASINWQDVWDHSLTYDFTAIEFDGDVFIFYANW